MIIELSNGSCLENTHIQSLEKTNNVWNLKMANKQLIPILESEYAWIMTICQFLVEIRNDFAFNLHAISFLIPTNTGFLMGWKGEPPVEVTEAEGQLIKEKLTKEPFLYLKLADRINELSEYNVSPSEYNKL